MERCQQVQLIEAICDSIRDEMVKNVKEGKVPEEWDGFEFRHWLEQIAKHENIWNRPDYKKSQRKRIRDCNNTIIVNNLF